jgi:hypothetical protein
MMHFVAVAMVMLAGWRILIMLGGCAELGKIGAKMHGLEVISADDCRHAFRTNPCKTVESKNITVEHKP